MICKNCKKEILNGSVFCKYCGTRLVEKETNTIVNSIMLFGITISLLLGLFGGLCLYDQYKIASSPSILTGKMDDTDISVVAEYHLKSRTISITLNLDEIIENWQVQYIGDSPINIKLTLKAEDGSAQKTIEFNNLSIMEGEKVSGICELIESSLQDFVQLKEIMSAENLSIKIPKVISVDKKEREKCKNQFIQEQKRLKALQSMSAGLL